MDQISDTFRSVLLPYLTSFDKPEDIPTDVALRSLGLNSMRAVELVIDLEDTFGIVFPDDSFTDEVFATAETLWEVVATCLAKDPR